MKNNLINDETVLFTKKITYNFCKKYSKLYNYDEYLSQSLDSLLIAKKKFDSKINPNFKSFAYKLIKFKLIDLLRKEVRYKVTIEKYKINKIENVENFYLEKTLIKKRLKLLSFKEISILEDLYINELTFLQIHKKYNNISRYSFNKLHKKTLKKLNNSSVLCTNILKNNKLTLN